MVPGAADLEGGHLILPSDAAQERPESLLQRRGNQGLPTLGTEDSVVVGVDVGDAAHSAVPPGLGQE